VLDGGGEHVVLQTYLGLQDKDRKQPGRSISSVVLPRQSPQSKMDQAEAELAMAIQVKILNKVSPLKIFQITKSLFQFLNSIKNGFDEWFVYQADPLLSSRQAVA
jgi:hypothetical protein